MNRVAINLRKLMKAHGLSENGLARHVEVPQPTIHRILAGDVADPRDRTLRPLATWFGVTVEQLRTELPDMDINGKDGAIYRIRVPKGTTVKEREPDIAIPEVIVRVFAPGSQPPFELAATGEHAPYPAAWFSDLQLAPARVRVLAVTGSGMEPILFEGDRMTISMVDTVITDGRVYLFISGGDAPDARIRRFFKTSDGKLRVVCDNPDKRRYPDELLDAQDSSRLTVIGRVIERRGAGGL